MDIGKFSRKDRRGWPRTWRKAHTAVAAVLLAGGAVVAFMWGSDLQRRVREAEARVKGLDEALAVVGRTLGETETARQRLQAFVDGVQSATEDRRGALGPALQALRASVEPGTEISSISAARDAGRAEGWRLNMKASLGGAAPRVLADRSRLKLQEMLARSYEVTEASRFERSEMTSGDSGRKPTFAYALSVAVARAAKPSQAENSSR
jgi:hypothetical protein